MLRKKNLFVPSTFFFLILTLILLCKKKYWCYLRFIIHLVAKKLVTGSGRSDVIMGCNSDVCDHSHSHVFALRLSCQCGGRVCSLGASTGDYRGGLGPEF